MDEMTDAEYLRKLASLNLSRYSRERLRSIADRLESPWVSCAERFPDDHRPAYLAADKEGCTNYVYIDGAYDEDGHFVPSHWIHSFGHEVELDEYTDWMVVPPIEDKD